jgi:hypothetical protein
MNDPEDPRVRLLQAEHADVGDRMMRVTPHREAPQTMSEIHDRAAVEADAERMGDIEQELHRLDRRVGRPTMP